MIHIDLKNVGIIREAHLGFVPGVNLILGASSSGKSTLLRALRSLADNSFTDAMVTHGQGVMQIDIQTSDAHVTYTRDTKARDRKACYVVNGEEYTKLGRQQLDVVADSLKMSSVRIDSENVNFNFSSQFSGPFLLLGSPSTLYSVLTYHDSFDVTRLDELYKSDVKSVSDAIKVNRKINERLSSEHEDAKAEADRLSGIPELYAHVAALRVKVERMERLRDILSRMDALHKKRDAVSKVIKSNYDLYAQITDILLKQRAALLTQKLIEMMSLCDKAKRRVLACTPVAMFDDRGLSEKVSTMQTLSVMVEKYEQMKRCRFALERSDGVMNFPVDKLGERLEALLRVRRMVDLYEKMRHCVIRLGKAPEFKDKFEVMEKCILFCELTRAIDASEQKVCQYMVECDTITAQMEAFGVCPLCGSPLNGHVLFHDEQIPAGKGLDVL